MLLEKLFRGLDRRQSENIGLDGEGGYFLLCCILYLKSYSFIKKEDLISLNNSLIDSIQEKNPLVLNYIDGLAGVYAIYGYLSSKKELSFLQFPDFDDANDALGEELLYLVNKNIWDNLYGAGGILAAFSVGPVDTKVLESVLIELNERTKKQETNDFIVNPLIGKHTVDFGIAHGYAGLGNILFNLLEKGVLTDLITTSLVNILKVFEDQPLNLAEEGANIFPIKYDMETGSYAYSAISGWCYGDLGIVNFVLKCSTLTALNPIYPNLKNTIQSIAERPLVKDQKDIFLCHGLSSKFLLRQALKNVNSNIHTVSLGQSYSIPVEDFLGSNNNAELNQKSLLNGGTGVCLTLAMIEREPHNDFLKLFFL
ncbi:lanthionine synthetase LanC family protein [Sphingobacterium sp. Lzh-3]|uniref:lanthionine synthetase LanC family protein n=1 Tax=Sphingobacterium sp. Lzh-3 TaxID=3382150 RepID=UPI00398D5561